MSDSYIQIDTECLDKDIKEVENCIRNARRSLSELMSELAELNTMWKGQANEAFQAQVVSDNALMTDMLDEMDKLKDYMVRASGLYVKSENEVVDLVRSMRV